MSASENSEIKERTSTTGSVTNIRKGSIQVVRISRALKRSLNGTNSFGPQTFTGLPILSPSARRFLAIRSINTIVRVLGTNMACRIWTAPPKLSWIQIFQSQARYCSTNPPTIGPKTEPPTEEETMKSCWNWQASILNACLPHLPRRTVARNSPICLRPWPKLPIRPQYTSLRVRGRR